MSEVIITVRGEHEARIAPERAVARLNIVAEGPERSAVVERMSALAEPLRQDLITRKESGTVAEWSSGRLSVWSERPWTGDGARLAPVHHATLQVSATFTDVAALSWWLGDIAETDGVHVAGVEWELTPETRSTVERDVAAEAVRVTVARANAYANALGLGSLTPLEIADTGLLHPGDGGPAPMMLKASRASFADAGGGPAVQFEPEDIVVSAAVEGRFTAR